MPDKKLSIIKDFALIIALIVITWQSFLIFDFIDENEELVNLNKVAIAALTEAHRTNISISRILNLDGADPNVWYKAMPTKVLNGDEFYRVKIMSDSSEENSND